jgi:hypothetical protein
MSYLFNFPRRIVWSAAVFGAHANVGAIFGADPPPVISFVDSVDAQYGSKIRQLRKDDGHEHNLYYNRDPWNADGTRLVVIHSDLAQQNWRLALCGGDGRFEKYLFTPGEYDWRIVWDRHDPDVLYTSHAASLYRYNVKTRAAELLKKFAQPLRPTGASLNQRGDRILVATADWTFHSFSLPDMQAERTFRPAVPKNYNSDKPAYTGHGDTVHVPYSDGGQEGILIYSDDGSLVHEFKGVGGGGHYDFSPQGKLAYFKLLPAPTRDGGRTLEIHVVNLNGADDRVLFRAAAGEMGYVQNLHLSWPDGINDWFVASLFPNASRLPSAYAPWLDEILLIKLDGTHRVLARSETAHARAATKGGAGDMFWAQPLGSPSADGRRIAFNSSRSGTIDACILYVDASGPPR